MPDSLFDAIIGRSDIQEGEADGMVYSMCKHPGFDQQPNAAIIDDIAIMRLAFEIEDPATVVIDTEHVEPQTVVAVLGWGMTETGDSPDDLQEAHVETIGNEACASALGYSIPDTILCLRAGSAGPCTNDSGGPLFRVGTDPPQQVGVISSGKGCGSHEIPRRATRLSKYIPWINQAREELGCDD
jgi:secreted trypsin-like serine protease